MTRRITCCVVFVTLIWGAHTDDEEKGRDMFKSNMTRNDFSNLLQSLIKLNEQRVGVLQKLYRLEDYGGLSEVLRSGDKKTGNGNNNNLFLIVMSKNQNDPSPSRRKIGFQLVDSVSSLNAGSNNNHPKLDFVLDPADYFTQNIRKETRLESIFGNFPRVGPTKEHRADDGSKKISTTKETLKFNKPGLRAEVTHDSNVLRPAISHKANEDRKYHKGNSRYEIVNNKGRRPNANEKLLGYDDNSKHSQTVGYNSQSNESVEIDFPTENEKQTTKPIKQVITSNHQNSKYPSRGKDEDDYGSPFSHIGNDQNRQHTKLISDISIKKYHDINHNNPKTNKYTPKVKVQSNKQKDKLTIKPIIIKDRLSSNYKNTNYPLEGSPFSHIKNDHNRQYTKLFSDISIKKYHYINHDNSKTNKYTPKVKVQSNQQKEKLTIKPIIIKDRSSSNYKNTKYPLEGKDELDEDDYSSLRQYTHKNSDISIKKLHVHNYNNPKTIQNTPKVNIQRNQHPKLNQNKYNLNNQGNKYSKINTIKTTTPKNDYRINSTVKKASEYNQFIKRPNLNNDNTNANNDDLTYTSIKDEYATNDTKLPSPAIENIYGGKPVIPEITKDTQYGSYPDFKDHKGVTDNSTKDKSEIVKYTLYGSYPDFEDHKNVRNNSNKAKAVTAKYTLNGNYLDFEDHKDVRYNSNKDKPKTAKHTPFENDPSFENLKVVRDNSNKDRPETTIGAFGNHFHGFEHYKNVMKNLNKYKPNTLKELHVRDKPNVKSKNYTDYYGVKMFDNGKSGEEFSVFITNVGNGTAEEDKQQNEPKLTLNAFDKPRSKHIARSLFAMCLNKKALKLCCKSCISSYKNVCRKLKCTSRSKKALKRECKRSCKKTFASSSSKYSDEYSSKESSDDENSDESDSDYDYS